MRLYFENLKKKKDSGVIHSLFKAVILNNLFTESGDDRLMESWVDLCDLVNMRDKYYFTNPYFREMRCLFVKQGGLDLLVKCSKTFPNNSDLIERMMFCMENVVQEEDSRHDMLRNDFVQQVLTLVNSNNGDNCWLAMNLAAT